MSDAPPILLARCAACGTTCVPRVGPCPRCQGVDLRPHPVPPVAVVLAATELAVPPPGFPAGHRLALVEFEVGARLLAVVDGDLPTRGGTVRVTRDGPLYRVRAT